MENRRIVNPFREVAAVQFHWDFSSGSVEDRIRPIVALATMDGYYAHTKQTRWRQAIVPMQHPAVLSLLICGIGVVWLLLPRYHGSVGCLATNLGR